MSYQLKKKCLRNTSGIFLSGHVNHVQRSYEVRHVHGRRTFAVKCTTWYPAFGLDVPTWRLALPQKFDVRACFGGGFSHKIILRTEYFLPKTSLFSLQMSNIGTASTPSVRFCWVFVQILDHKVFFFLRYFCCTFSSQLVNWFCCWSLRKSKSSTS